MRAINVKVNGEEEGIIVLCKCGNISNINKKELEDFGTIAIQCSACKEEIVLKKDPE